ncbi:adiponectin receptor protein [Ilyonectria sp. MPI-CAGE-AT-0026]|nr:adiponectin receptor protein [Ilyonectria sp. MPI-CAGE-AT-0026]
MPLYQRLSPASSRMTSESPPRRPAAQQPKTKYRLLLANELPSWYAHNSFLRTGYRPINGSVRLCANSLRFIHNETVNIYSHLIPAAIALAGNCFLHRYFRDRYPAAPLADQLAIHVYLMSSLLCFGISSICHTLHCHSEACSGLWDRLDYAAIILQTVGSFVSGIYVTFYCNPGLKELYWTMGRLLSTIIVVNPRFQSSRWRKLRIATFVAMGFSGLLPVIHAACIYPFAQWNQQAGLGYYLVEGLALILGVVFYTKFDIWGASHQIFHLFVVLSAAIHIWGVLSVYDWIYNNLQC